MQHLAGSELSTSSNSYSFCVFSAGCYQIADISKSQRTFEGSALPAASERAQMQLLLSSLYGDHRSIDDGLFLV